MKKKTTLVKVQDWAHADIRDCIERIEELTGELQAKEETLKYLKFGGKPPFAAGGPN